MAWQRPRPTGDAARPAPGIPVRTSVVEAKAVPVEVSAIGRIEPLATVTVRSRIDSAIESAHFTEGQEVKTGDLLFTLDDSPPPPPCAPPRPTSPRTRPSWPTPRPTSRATPTWSRATPSPRSNTRRRSPTPRACRPRSRPTMRRSRWPSSISLHPDPLADRRPHRRRPGQGRQPGEGPTGGTAWSPSPRSGRSPSPSPCRSAISPPLKRYQAAGAAGASRSRCRTATRPASSAG